MDLKIETENARLKVRANAVIVHDGKLLVCAINDNGYWCCPGGHIHMGEDSKTAVIRESFEEVGIKFDDAKLLLMMESFFKGKNEKRFHELGFYYLMQGEIPEEKLHDYSYDEDDGGRMVHLQFKWVAIKDLDSIDLRPVDLKKKLQSGNFETQHLIRVEN